MDNISAVNALAIAMLWVSSLAFLASLWIGNKTRTLRAANAQRRLTRQTRQKR